MSMETQKARLESGMVPESVQVEAVTAAHTLAVYEQVALVDSTLGAITLTLPPVGEAKGKFYSILFQTDNGDLTVQDQDDAYDWTDLTVNDAGECLLLYSDGLKWHICADDRA